jgi:hypothetical protein
VYSQHHTKWGKTEIITSTFKNETRISTLSLLFYIALEFMARAIRQEKEKKRIQIGRSQTRSIHRQNDLIPKSPKKLYQKTRHHK